MSLSDLVKRFPTITRVSGEKGGLGRKRRTEGGETSGGRPKQPNVTAKAPGQRQRPVRKLLLRDGKGPGDTFSACPSCRQHPPGKE